MCLQQISVWQTLTYLMPSCVIKLLKANFNILQCQTYRSCSVFWCKLKSAVHVLTLQVEVALQCEEQP